MSRYFPQAAYAEDQKLSKTLLAFHVLHRGFQTGAMAGAITSIPAYYGAKLLPDKNLLKARILVQPFQRILLKSTGLGAIAGIALLVVGLEAQMWGKEPIEWKDRSWRLRSNKGQMQCDDFALLGTAAGLYLARAKDWKVKVGGAALGNVVGVAGYMVWRYGMKGGVWKDKETDL